MNKKIPVFSIEIGQNEKKYINDCLDTSWIGQGGYVTVRCASAAQLAFAVLPPTGYCTNVQDGAGMIVTRRESDCGTTRSKAVG